VSSSTADTYCMFKASSCWNRKNGIEPSCYTFVDERRLFLQKLERFAVKLAADSPFAELRGGQGGALDRPQRVQGRSPRSFTEEEEALN